MEIKINKENNSGIDAKDTIFTPEEVKKIEEDYNNDCYEKVKEEKTDWEYLWTKYKLFRGNIREYMECKSLEEKDFLYCDFLKNKKIGNEEAGFQECQENYNFFVNIFIPLAKAEKQFDIKNICDKYFIEDENLQGNNCIAFFSSIDGKNNYCNKITDLETEKACQAFYDKKIVLGFDYLSVHEHDNEAKRRMKNLYPMFFEQKEICDEYYNIDDQLYSLLCLQFDIRDMSQEEILKLQERTKNN
ncbi:hypothetical protein KAU09_00055 [Candidatus Parcubacteria bacterium]|nr:hypothetical protein [Candidatus Parcubacteria bacterium]